MANNSTDTRIVQMQFDNKDFEKNIAQSEKSLDKFKEALDFAECEKSLEDFGDATKKLTFDQMADNLQKLADKFTGLGTVSEFVLSKVRQGFESAAAKAKSFFDSMTIEQVNAGFQKFGEMNKSVQTIMAATGESEEKVYDIMKRLNTYTDWTSYSFTDMAANIGKFTSVGIKLEDAEKQMEGIANWAARSGGGIQEASRAMYNLSQAMGAGALTKIDWKSIENASMATKEFKEQLIEAGLAEGTLVREGNKILTNKSLGKQMEVTYQNVAETLQKRWATTGVMQRSFMAYYFDDITYQGTSTLIEVTKEQKKILEDAYQEDSKLGEKTWKNLEKQGIATEEIKQKAIDAAVASKNLVKETTKDGKTIYKTAEKYGKQMEVTLDNFEKSLSTGWLDKGVAKNVWAFDELAKAAYESAQKCLTFTDVLNAWKDQLSSGWMQSYQHIFGNLSESMELFTNICNKVSAALGRLIEFRNMILETWGNSGGRENLWSLIVGEVIDADTGEVLAYENAYGLLDVFMDIGNLLREGFWNVMKMFAPDDVLALWDNEDARAGWMASQIDQIVIKIKNFVSAIHDFFNASADGSQKSRWQQIQDVVNAIYAAFVLAYTVVRDVVGFLGNLFDENHLGKSLDSILKLLSALGIGVYNMADSAEEGEGLKKLFDGLLVSLEPLIAAINTVVDVITGNLIGAIENGQEAGTFANIWQTICDIFVLFGNIVSKVAPPVLDFIASILQIINDLFSGELTGDKLKALGTRLEGAITKLFDDIFSLIPGFGKDLQGFIAYIFGFAEEGAEDGADESSKTIVGVAKQWLRKIFGGFANLYDNIKNDANQFNLFTWAKDMLGIGSFGKFIGDMAGVVKGTNLYGIIMSFLGGYALFKLIGVLRTGKGLLGNLQGFFQGAQNVMKDGLKLKFGDQLESTGDKVQKIATGIALIAGSVAVLGSMNTDSLLKGFGALAGVMIALGVFLAIMKNFILKDWKDAIGLTGVIGAVALAILSITLGIGLLVLMLKPLANMQMEGIIKMLTGLFGVVTILGLMATYIGKDMKNLKGAGSIAAMAIAIGILIFALKPLADMEWEGMIKMGVGLVAIMYILTEFSNKVGSLKIKGGGSIAVLAAAIGILILSLLNLKDLSLEQLGKLGVSLMGILAMLKLFSDNVSSMKGTGMAQMVLLAGSIWILIQAIMPLAALDWGQLGKLGAGLAGIMLIIGIFINSTQSMANTGMGNILMVAASIWILVRALEPLANYEWGQLAKMGAGLVVMAAVVVGMTHLVGEMNIAQGVSAALMMVGLALVLLTFGFAMSALNGLSWDQIAVACSGIVGVIAAFGIIQKALLSDSDILDAVHTLILLGGLAVVMIAFSIALNEIKNVPTDKILAFSVGLGILVAAVGGALLMTRGMTLVGALKGILIISAAVAALMVVFAVVGKFAMGTISSGLTNMAANLKLFSGMIGDFSDRMKNVDEAGIEKAKRIIGMLTSLLSDLGGIVVGAASATALTTMSSHLTLTSGMLIDFGTRMASVDEAAFTKAQTIITMMKGMMESLEGFDKFTSQREAFTTALFDLGTGVEIFASHTGNVGDLSNNSALQLIQDLSACAGDMETIAKMNIDDLSAKLTGLGGAMMLYAKGAEEATGLEVQAEGAPDVEGAVKLLRDISNSLAEKGGFTVPENMPSEEQLGTFGAQLAALAGALVMFEEAGSQLGTGTEQALACLEFFKSLKEKLVEIDMGQAMATVMTAFITGEAAQVQPNELETFGKNIEQLGLALAAFAKSTTIMDESTGEIAPVDYSKAIEALESFSDLANSLPTIGGIRSWWEGNKQSLTDLGADLEALGQGLKDFMDKVTGKAEGSEFKGLKDDEIEEGKTASLDIVEKAVDILTKITEAQSKLEPVGGITSIWSGDPPSFNDLGAQLEGLGQGLRDFSDKVTGTGEGGNAFSPDQATAALGVIDSMIEVMTAVNEKLPTVGGLGNFFGTIAGGRLSTLTDVGSQIGGLGEGMSTFADAISGKFQNAEEMVSALGVVNQVVEMITSMASVDNMIKFDNITNYIEYIHMFLEGMSEDEHGIRTHDNTMIQDLVSMMSSLSEAIDIAGNIDAANIGVFTAFTEGLHNLATLNLSTVETDFQNVGKAIAAGVATGIEAGQSTVVTAAVNMALAAYRAACITMGIKSPSRVFMQMGRYTAEGMAIGIRESSGLAVSASESMANDSIESARNLLANISTLLASDIDSQPTIRPVLDLSNVTAGAQTLNGMFGQYGVGLSTTGISNRAARSFSAYGTDTINQNGTDTESMMARMDAMLENIQKMGDGIANMKFVLDTGVVAGGVADDVDIDIGRKMFYAERRN